MRQNQNHEHLYNILVKISNLEDMEKFLSSLCTESELNKMSQRLLAAKMFLLGAKYKDIVKETNASTATLAKIRHDLFNGKKGLAYVQGQ